MSEQFPKTEDAKILSPKYEFVTGKVEAEDREASLTPNP